MCRFNFEIFAKKLIDKYLKDYSNKKYRKYQILLDFKNNNYKNLYTSYKICKDNYVGKISSYSPELFILKEFRINNIRKLKISKSQKTINEKIVVLMESPHQSEYTINLVAPALGATGEKLHTYLPQLLLKYSLVTSEKSEIFLMNVIQYQCSLGFNTNICREKLFAEMWDNKKTKLNLIKRLKKIKPSIIVVAMTSIAKNKYKNEIIKLLTNKGFIVWEADVHPSKWNNQTTLIKR